MRTTLDWTHVHDNHRALRSLAQRAVQLYEQDQLGEVELILDEAQVLLAGSGSVYTFAVALARKGVDGPLFSTSLWADSAVGDVAAPNVAGRRRSATANSLAARVLHAVRHRRVQGVRAAFEDCATPHQLTDMHRALVAYAAN